jgi:hypothetical protein
MYQRFQFVVIGRGQKSPHISVRALLENCPDVVILDELDSSTVLAEMSEDVRKKINRKLPQLVIEPNLQYKISVRKSAVRRKLANSVIHAAFSKATKLILVAASRWAFSRRYLRLL